MTVKAMLLIVSGTALFAAAFCFPVPACVLIAGAGLNLILAGLVR